MVKTKKSIKKERIFDRFKEDIDHNAVVGVMVKLIAVGMATNDRQSSMSADVALYINHLLGGLRR